MRKKGAAYAAPFSRPWGMKKGPSERAVLDGTGCGGAVPSSRGRKGSAAACRRSGKHGGSIALWPGKAMPRARSVQFDTLSRRQGRMRAGRARPGAEDRPAGLCLRLAVCRPRASVPSFGPVRLVGTGGCGYTKGVSGWGAAAGPGCGHERRRWRWAIFNFWKILWKNVPCANCWPRLLPCVRGTSWPVSRPRMRKSASGPRWPWPMCP